MARKKHELNKNIKQCVLNALMTIKLCGGDDGFDELAIIKCVSIRLDQIVNDGTIGIEEHAEDFDIDCYIDAYIELVNMEDFNNDQKNV